MKNLYRSFLLAVPLAFFLLFSPFALAETIILNGTSVLDDTSIYNYSSGNWYLTNAGNMSVIQTFKWEKIGFVKFNLSSLPANITITSATLDMMMQNTGTDSVSVFNTSLYNSSGAGPWKEGSCLANPTTCYCSGAGCAITANMTWNNKVSFGTYQDIKTMPGAGYVNKYVGNWSVTNAVKTAYAQSGVNQSVSFAINSSASSVTFYSSESGATPRLWITYTPGEDSCGLCGIDPLDNTSCYKTTFDGSYCLEADQYGIYTTTGDCSYSSYYACPSGTVCKQITPQADITTPLIEDQTDCSVCLFAKAINPLNGLTYTWWTNCPNNLECDNCDGSICRGINFISNLTSIPATASYYTAGCYNPNISYVIDVIDQYGNHTNITELTNSIFNVTNYTYAQRCTNSTTICYDASCNEIDCGFGSPSEESRTSAAGQLAVLVGSFFGISDLTTSLMVFSILISLCIGFIALYYLRNNKESGMAFIIITLVGLVMFTFIGWFPGWIMILLIIISALGMAKTLGIGG